MSDSGRTMSEWRPEYMTAQQRLDRIEEILVPQLKEPLYVDYGPRQLPRVQVMFTAAEARELVQLVKG